ncbi:GntR family transcriptional regulator [Curtobacterium sp. UCD-KPL2560]|uniref:GntR family transcriptional regulator n=1 Tax=Curtobacterium sp. UCD-KPL2560 TaxID=1885315 RepID=UPI0008258ABA|nr:GntR family transcriptional regulator [Curtobacterium sp. UCD-KPL2560]
MFATVDAEGRPRLRDQARERLRGEILDGSLPPGARLDDVELAVRLRCSRTPVREALSDLAHAGLVEFRPNRYTRVTVPRREEIVPSMQALGLLFGGVARTTVPVLSDRSRTRLFRALGELLDQMGTARGCSPPDTASRLYRDLIAECRNPLLASTLRSAADGLTFRLRHEELRSALPWEHVRNGIVALRVAIDCRDGRLAERAVATIHLLPDPDRDRDRDPGRERERSR